MASDNFTNSDGTALATHDSNWTQVDTSYIVANLEINNNLAEHVGTWDRSSAFYSSSSEDTSQIVIKGIASEIGTNVRAACRMGASQFGYGALLTGVSNGNYVQVQIVKNNSWLSTLTAAASISVADDHTVKIVVSGTTTVNIEIFVDTVSQGDYDDGSSPVGAGSPGFFTVQAATVDLTRVDDWTDLASAGLTLSPNDTINMSDSIIIKVEINKSDNLTLSDSIIKSIGLNKSDSISMSDNIYRVSSFVRSLSDTINLTDELLKSVEIVLSDTINLSDDFSAIITLILSLNDSITLSDSILKTPNINKSDAINISDEIIKSFGLSETDTINLTDIISKSMSTTRSDTINMSDNFSSLITLILALNDTINMSDSILKEIDIVKSDTINLSDNIIRSFGLTKSDIINLADGFSTDADVIYALLNFVAENKTFNFNAKNKTFNFNAKSRGN